METGWANKSNNRWGGPELKETQHNLKTRNMGAVVEENLKRCHLFLRMWDESCLQGRGFKLPRMHSIFEEASKCTGEKGLRKVRPEIGK